MPITIRGFQFNDIRAMCGIWNEVIRAGDAFPQTGELANGDAIQFFSEQSFSGIAEDAQSGEIMGLYILHPNNVGRCGHIANASYAVGSGGRGRGVGEQLVRHSLDKARELGFTIMQFNAVVDGNSRAIRIYDKLGFNKLGTIPNGFRLDTGYRDIHLYFKTLG